MLSSKSAKMPMVLINGKVRKCPKCGSPLIVRSSRVLADNRHRVRYMVCSSKRCAYTEKQLVSLF